MENVILKHKIYEYKTGQIIAFSLENKSVKVFYYESGECVGSMYVGKPAKAEQCHTFNIMNTGLHPTHKAILIAN